MSIADLDPANAMARGWTITRGPDGRVLRSIAAVASGDVLTTTLLDGTVRSTVDVGTDQAPEARATRG